MPTRVLYRRVTSKPNQTGPGFGSENRFESFAAKRTFAKKKGKTQMWITIIVVVCTVLLALLCAVYCQCGDRIYTAGNNNRRNEQEPLIVEGKPMPPP